MISLRANSSGSLTCISFADSYPVAGYPRVVSYDLPIDPRGPVFGPKHFAVNGDYPICATSQERAASVHVAELLGALGDYRLVRSCSAKLTRTLSQFAGFRAYLGGSSSNLHFKCAQVVSHLDPPKVGRAPFGCRVVEIVLD